MKKLLNEFKNNTTERLNHLINTIEKYEVLKEFKKPKQSLDLYWFAKSYLTDVVKNSLDCGYLDDLKGLIDDLDTLRMYSYEIKILGEKIKRPLK